MASGYQQMFRTMLFQRIVPIVRDIGLWSDKIQSAYAEMGVLGFADVDYGELMKHDNDRAEEFDEYRLKVEEAALPDDALEEARRAQAADPDDPLSHVQQALLAEEWLGDPAQARDHWEAVLALTSTRFPERVARSHAVGSSRPHVGSGTNAGMTIPVRWRSA